MSRDVLTRGPECGLRRAGIASGASVAANTATTSSGTTPAAGPMTPITWTSVRTATWIAATAATSETSEESRGRAGLWAAQATGAGRTRYGPSMPTPKALEALAVQPSLPLAMSGLRARPRPGSKAQVPSRWQPGAACTPLRAFSSSARRSTSIATCYDEAQYLKTLSTLVARNLQHPGFTHATVFHQGSVGRPKHGWAGDSAKPAPAHRARRSLRPSCHPTGGKLGGFGG